MTHKIQTAVVGVTGYAGAELARLLLKHPRIQGTPPVFAGRVDEKDTARGGVPLSEIHPQLADSSGSGNLRLEPFSWELLASKGVEVLFLATPHEQSREWAPEALKRGLRVIDLSAAWRLNEASNRAVYAFEDENSKLAAATQAHAVYGMPELHRAHIAGARLIANPGCTMTSGAVTLAKPVRKRRAFALVDRMAEKARARLAAASSCSASHVPSLEASSTMMISRTNAWAVTALTHVGDGGRLVENGNDNRQTGRQRRFGRVHGGGGAAVPPPAPLHRPLSTARCPFGQLSA